METGHKNYRYASDHQFANPLYVSGAGTNLLSGENYYNLIESDYYKKYKDRNFSEEDCVKYAKQDTKKEVEDGVNEEGEV